MSYFFKSDFNVIFNKNTGITNDIFIYEVGFENCKPYKNIEYIPIDYYLIHYCTKGEGTLEIYGKEQKICSGDLFLIPPKTNNKYRPIKENPWNYCWFGLNGIIVKDIIEKCGFTENNPILKNSYDENLLKYFEDIFDSCYDNNHLKSIGNLYLLLNYLNEKNSLYREKPLSTRRLYLKNILYYIHENYQKEIKISTISTLMNIDRTYIYKIFKKYLNMSPQQYILNYRIEKATILLRKSNLNVIDISEKVGFNTYTYFVKQFKKSTGLSPLEYKKKFTI